MRTRAAIRHGFLLITAGLALGCAERAPVAPPRQAPSLLILDPAEEVTALQRLTPLPRDITAGAWINTVGGSLSIPEAGLTVTVPMGAVRKPTYFSVTAHAGDLVSYEFGPHGMKFSVPLRMQQDIKDLSIWKVNGDLSRTVLPIEAGYFPSRSSIDARAKTAIVNEVLPVDIDLTGNKIRFQVVHFSGYMLASGRKG